MLPANVFAAVTQSLHIGHHNVGFVLLIFIRVCVDVIVLGSDVFLTSNACPCPKPMLGTCNYSVLYSGDLLPSLAVVDWNRLS